MGNTANMGSLLWVSGIDNTNIKRDAAQTSQIIGGVGNTADSVTGSIGKMGAALGVALSVAGLASLGMEVVNVRGEFQQLNIAFETMLGNKDKADKLMTQAVEFAAKTPFQLTDVASNIKQLMAMGIATEDVMKTVKALGDVSAGVSVDLGRVALNYGQVATQGKLMGREMRDFMIAGIPLADELAKNLNKTKAEIADMVTAGQIGFKDVEKAFQTMSGEGGKFFNLMEKQSGSVTGQISNLSDKIAVMMNEIGTANEGMIYSGIKGVGVLIDNYKGILSTLGVLVSVYGSYRAALILSAAAQAVSTTAGVYDIATKELAVIATVKATVAQSALNKAILANPYAAAVAGIVALVSIIYVLSEKAKTADDYVSELNDSMSQIGKQLEIDEAVQKFEELNSIENKTTEQQDELNKTIQKLSTIFPEAITETDKYGNAIDLVQEKVVALNKELRDNLIIVSEKKAQDSQAGLNKLLEEQLKLQEQINTGKQTVTVKNPRSGGDYELTTVFTQEDIDKKRNELALLTESIVKLGSTVDAENQKVLQLKTIDANAALKDYRQYFGDVATMSKEAAIKAKTELQKIITPEGSVAGNLVKDQITAIDQYLAKLKTTGQQIAEWKKQLTTARAELKKINDENYTSIDPEKDKADQEAIIKSLEEKLGLKKKEKKAVDELKQAQDELEKAVKSGNETAIKSAVKRVEELEKQKNLLDGIKESELTIARNRELPIKGSTSISGAIDDMKKSTGLDFTKGFIATGTLPKLVAPEWDKLNKKINESGELQKKLDDKKKKSDEEKKKLQDEIISGAYQFTNELVTQLGLSKDQEEQLKGTVDIIANLASGNLVSAGFSLLGMITKSFVKEEESMSDYFNSMNEHITRVVDSISLINETLSSMGKGSSVAGIAILQSELIKLKNDAARLNEQLLLVDSSDRRRGTTTQGTGTSGTRENENANERIRVTVSLISQTEKLNEEILILSNKLLNPNLTEEQRKSIELVLNGYNDIINAIDTSIQDITGTSINELSNSIVDAFLAGESAAESWGEKVNDIIGNIVKRQLINELLTKPITEAIQTLIGDTKDGLTPEEAKKFKDTMSLIPKLAEPSMDAAFSGLESVGINLQNQSSKSSSSLVGSVKGITEDTADILVGRIMKVNTDMDKLILIGYDQNDILDIQNGYLKKIELNTQEIPNIKTELVAMNKILTERL